MKFEFVLNLVNPDYAKNSPLADKKIFIYDHKNRLMDDFTLCDGYSITENSKEALKTFCEKTNPDCVRFFVIRLDTDSICIYDEFRVFKLKIDRA